MSHSSALNPSDYEGLVRRALAEDIGAGDVTTEATVAPDVRGHGVLVAKSRLVVAGLDVAFAVFKTVAGDRPLAIEALVTEGDRVEPGTVLAVIDGPAAALLTAERTALNLLQRLSGIATATRAAVEATGGRIAILDTRKTTPTLRALEKYAVRVGGGRNHRFGLYDLVLIKDNHVRLAGGVTKAVDAARRRSPGVPIEIEAQTVAQAAEAADAGADIVLLDNLSTAQIRTAVERIGGRAKTEISGNVTTARLPELATTGADFVSMGALTHSVQAADISFEIEPFGEAR
jgi:nicotinate-nucleotide pyrophosphorylase (carboxylating)